MAFLLLRRLEYDIHAMTDPQINQSYKSSLFLHVSQIIRVYYPSADLASLAGSFYFFRKIYIFLGICQKIDVLYIITPSVAQ